MAKKERVTRPERWSKIITYLQSVEYAPTINDIKEATGIHANTLINYLKEIEIVQNDINKIKLVSTRRGMIVLIEKRK